SIDQSATDIEGAIDTAIRNFAPHHLKRLVLISDGNENSGHMLNMLSRLKSENIRLYTVPMQARTNRDVWVENIMAPAVVTAEDTICRSPSAKRQIPADRSYQRGP